MEFQLMFPKFEPIRFIHHIKDSQCTPDRDLITYVDFNGCMVANTHTLNTATTRRLEVMKQGGSQDDIASTMYNKEDVEFSVNKTSIHISNGHESLLPKHCNGVFKLNKGSQIVVPVTIEFSDSSCEVELEFLNGIPRSPEKRRFTVPEKVLTVSSDDTPERLDNRKIQALDSAHFSRYDDETIFVNTRNDPNSYWRLFAAMAASMVFMLVGIGYFIVTKFKPTIIGRLKPNTMSFSNPNIELSNQPGQGPDAEPNSNQVIFSSGGVIFKNHDNPTENLNHGANNTGFTNRIYEQSL
ncbi:unnamed protein product [Bursaphelenchus okinawaensis]|uniref:Uncharacterized protein n=1 Tax=Bursaphelenchus okinawaensis TaxID=465554 RepID=A0A811JQZ0_9BILA|nr:unnamed protein product [Bursaphelenchus okinawaensis]CAG9079108.1 unnamed protein product [Bursaphelenchus okinawaensis]